MPDLNMEAAWHLANGLGAVRELPESLNDSEIRARFVDAIDAPLIQGNSNGEAFKYLGARLVSIARKSSEYIPEISGSLLRVNIALRLWSGCLSAAKTIALETRDGENTPEGRRKLFESAIDPRAASDPIYRAGVEAAPLFKQLRQEEISFEGVPENSPVCKFKSSV